MKYYIVYLLFFSLKLHAQSHFSAKSQALGENGVVVEDVWSMNTNPAGMRKVLNATLGLAYEQVQLQTPISSQSVVLVLPFKAYRAGIGFSSYGLANYRMQQMALSFEKQFGPNLSMGLGLKMHQLKITDYGKRSSYTLDLGVMYDFSNMVTLGLHVQNVGNSTFSSSFNSAINPLKIDAGMAYRANDQLCLLASFSQTISQNLIPKMGLDYQLIPALALRGGLSLDAVHHFAGMGYASKNMHLDWSIVNRTGFGLSTQFSMTYAF